MLLWIEGFEGFGTTVDAAPSPANVVARKYATIASEANMKVATGRLSGYALKMQTASGCYIQPLGLTTNATMVVGVAIKADGWADAALLALYDGATLGVNIHRTAEGELAVYRGTTLLGTTSGLGIGTGIWYYIELKVVCSDTGSYELRVNGVNVLSDETEDTKAGTHDYHDMFRLQGITGSGTVVHYDDLYCLDGSGSVNNNFLGNMRVVAIRPTSDDTGPQWTPGTGTDHYALVDDVGTEDGTNEANSDYVQDSVTDHKDLYGYGNLSGITGGIKGVQINTDCRNTDVTGYTLKTVCKSGDTESDDAGQAVGSTNYTTKRRILETDPDSDPAAAWTVDGVNAALFGIKVG